MIDTNEEMLAFTLTAARGARIRVEIDDGRGGFVPLSSKVPARLYMMNASELMHDGITPQMFQEMVDGTNQKWEIWRAIAIETGVRLQLHGAHEVVSVRLPTMDGVGRAEIKDIPIYETVEKVQFDVFFESLRPRPRNPHDQQLVLKFTVSEPNGCLSKTVLLIVKGNEMIMRSRGQSDRIVRR